MYVCVCWLACEGTLSGFFFLQQWMSLGSQVSVVAVSRHLLLFSFGADHLIYEYNSRSSKKVTCVFQRLVKGFEGTVG